MKKLLTILMLAACMAPVLADDAGSSPPASGEVQTSTAGTVSITAKGSDVREVLHSLFTQSKKNFVLAPNIRFALFLNLEGVEFDEALAILCRLATLDYQIQNGIYFIGKGKEGGGTMLASARLPVKPEQSKPEAPKIVGKLPITVLQQRLTTRMPKADLRDLMTEISRQTGIAVEVDPSVPAYKVDAFLINTSLKYSLDLIAKAASLEYIFTDRRSILLRKPDENRVSLIASGQD